MPGIQQEPSVFLKRSKKPSDRFRGHGEQQVCSPSTRAPAPVYSNKPSCSLEENRKGGQVNFALECGLFQSAGEGDKEVAMGTVGMGKADPIHAEQEVLVPVECAGCGAPGSRIPE